MTIATTLVLTVQMPDLDRSSRWSDLESFGVAMSKDLPAQALAASLHEAQSALLERCCGPAWRPTRHLRARSRVRAARRVRTSPATASATARASCAPQSGWWS